MTARFETWSPVRGYEVHADVFAYLAAVASLRNVRGSWARADSWVEAA